MNRQQVFDLVANHLLTQMEKSYDSQGRVARRSPTGLKDVIGILTPDWLYNKSNFEYLDVMQMYIHSKTEDYDLFFGLFDVGVTINFLEDLCNIHDHGQPQVWQQQLDRLADQYQLNKEVLKQFNNPVINSIKLREGYIYGQSCPILNKQLQ